jgi:hypothetical protein
VAFELFVPVYRTEPSRDATAAERRRLFLGWATGQFRAQDFLDSAMQTAPPYTGVELRDPTAGDDSLVASYPAGFRASGPLVREDTFKYGGRRFTLRFAPLPGNAILTERTIGAPVVLATGVAVSVLLGALLWMLVQVGALYREVGRLARTDSLTGVANRRGWDEELPRELARAAPLRPAGVRRPARPRPFQALQRRARAPGRGPAAQGCRRRLGAPAAQDRPAGPLRR